MKKLFFLLVLCLLGMAQGAAAQMSTSTNTVSAPVISGVATMNITSQGVQVTWVTDQSSDSRVAYGTSPSAYQSISSSNCTSGSYTTAHCVNLSGLTPSTVYYYRVESTNSYGATGQLDGFQFTTAPSTTSTSGSGTSGGSTSTTTTVTGTAPSAPSNVYATVSSDATVGVAWTDTSSNEDLFRVYRRNVGGSWAQIGERSANSIGYSDQNVPRGYYYEYAVAACNSYGCSTPSSSAAVYVPTTTTTTTTTTTATTTSNTTMYAPAAPSNLSATAPTTNSVYLVWTDNATTENYFVLMRRPTGGTWVQVGTESSGKTSHTDSSVPYGSYDYQIAACNSYGCSGPSNVASVSLVQPTTQVTASTTTTTLTNLTVVTAKGEVRGASGEAVPGTTLYFSGASSKMSALSGSDGTFSISLYPGTYTVDVIPPYGSLYVKPASQTITIDQNGNPSVAISLSLAAKRISGTVTLSGGGAVGAARVVAYSSNTGQWQEAFTSSSGAYALSVGGGSWQVGVKPADTGSSQWYWSGSPVTVSFSADATSETRSVNFTVMPANAPLTVIAKDQGGTPISSVGISISTQSASGATVQNQPSYGVFAKTDASGTAVFSLPPGTYYLRTGLPSGSGYLELPEQTVSVASGEVKPLALTFSKVSVSQTVRVTGRVRLADGTPVPAFVYAWSEQGASMSTAANSDGTFSFALLPNMRWHCGAGKDYNGTPLKAPEITYDVGATGITLDLVLAPPPQTTVFTSVTVSKPAGETIVAESASGAKVTVPPNSVSTSGNVHVAIKPTVEAPQQAAAQLVSTVFDITATDASGRSVSALANDVEIVIPYDPASLAGKGVSTGSIIPSYFDETTQTWVRVSDYTVDAANKRVILHVNHFTRFALIAAADITPPSAPSGVTASATGGGRISLAWQNPTSDFDHAKVYRSTVSGTLGKLVAAVVETNAYTDEDSIIDKTTYYYTVRAVDTAGNESSNTDQKSIVAVGSSAASSGTLLLPPGQASATALTRRLALGSSGNDVRLLQGILKSEGVYPSGRITGYFGALTRQAVVKFQQKYSTEVLKPYGLTKGTGIVGPATRAKLNEILSSPS